MTMMPAMTSCSTISPAFSGPEGSPQCTSQPHADRSVCRSPVGGDARALPHVPRSLTSPYIPETTYATASPKVMSTPRSFWAPSLYVAVVATLEEHGGSVGFRAFAQFVLPKWEKGREGEGNRCCASLLALPMPFRCVVHQLLPGPGRPGGCFHIGWDGPQVPRASITASIYPRFVSRAHSPRAFPTGVYACFRSFRRDRCVV